MASHSGKLSRQIDSGEYLRVKQDWNIYEKVLLRRIYRASADKDLSVVFELYSQYAKDDKCIYVHEKKPEAVQKALRKMQILEK